MSTLHKSSQDQLRQFVEQIERLDEDRKALVADIRDKFLEAKAVGFDPKIMKKVLALRRKDPNERTEEEALIDTYCHALGMTGTGNYHLDISSEQTEMSADRLAKGGVNG